MQVKMLLRWLQLLDPERAGTVSGDVIFFAEQLTQVISEDEAGRKQIVQSVDVGGEHRGPKAIFRIEYLSFMVLRHEPL